MLGLVQTIFGRLVNPIPILKEICLKCSTNLWNNLNLKIHPVSAILHFMPKGLDLLVSWKIFYFAFFTQLCNTFLAKYNENISKLIVFATSFRLVLIVLLAWVHFPVAKHFPRVKPSGKLSRRNQLEMWEFYIHFFFSCVVLVGSLCRYRVFKLDMIYIEVQDGQLKLTSKFK